MASPELHLNVLRHIRFADARKMAGVKTGEAQLAYLSPPHVGHHTRDEREQEKNLLDGLLREAARVTDPNYGFVVTYNTDFYLEGGVYLRHDAVRKAAEANGLELYSDKILVSSFARDLYRMGFHHLQIFIHEGSKESARKRNKRIPLYEPSAWFADKNQKVKTFRDANPPEAAVIPIANFTEKGELVVSQCAGTGTVVIAALAMKRKSVGYEIEKNRMVLMKERQKNFLNYFSDPRVLAIFQKNFAK